MSAKQTTGGRSIDPGDLMLWVAGAGIAALGLTWLLLSHPWSTSADSASSAQPVVSSPQTDTSAPADNAGEATGQAAADSGLDNPLHMAQLAYKAGMLDQPEQYSAWALFRQVLAKDPKNAAAEKGLAKVAHDLLQRADVAVEQGRYDDARSTAKRVLAAFPNDPDAKALLAKLHAESSQPASPPVVASTPTPPTERASAPVPVLRSNLPAEKTAPKARKRTPAKPTEQDEPAAPAVAAEAPQAPNLDRVLKAHEAFLHAMSQNHLLTPANASAKHYVAVLTRLAPKNQMTVDARQMLFKDLLSRSQQALKGLDTDAARAWIDAAAALNVDPDAVAKARNALTDKVVAMESQRPLPASALKLVSYAAPQYPPHAIEQNVEGWIDLEFTVAKDGTTRDIKVTDSKNDYYFHAAAVTAVRQWRFKPRVLMGRTIAQRVFTKINFTLSNKQ